MSYIQKEGKSSTWRDGMMRNLATSLIVHGRIETVKSRAKYLQQEVDNLITIAKQGDLASIRRLKAYLRPIQNDQGKTAIDLIKERAAKYKNRDGGYTRVLNIANRRGDNSEMALIEFV